jgi:hypothetical protein
LIALVRRDKASELARHRIKAALRAHPFPGGALGKSRHASARAARLIATDLRVAAARALRGHNGAGYSEV